jgi:hypothetical protein
MLPHCLQPLLPAVEVGREHAASVNEKINVWNATARNAGICMGKKENTDYRARRMGKIKFYTRDRSELCVELPTVSCFN